MTSFIKRQSRRAQLLLPTRFLPPLPHRAGTDGRDLHPQIGQDPGADLCTGLLALRLWLLSVEVGSCYTADHSVHAARTGWPKLAPSWSHLYLALGQVGLCPQTVNPVNPEGILFYQAVEPGRQESMGGGRFEWG